MKKKHLTWISITALALLAGCSRSGGSSSLSASVPSSTPSSTQDSEPESNSSVSSSSEGDTSSSVIEEKAFTLSDAVTLLGKASAKEATTSSGAVYTRKTIYGTLIDEEKETILVHTDGSSTSTGTITETEKGVITKSDTFSSLKETVTDRIQNGDVVHDYPMFVSIRDYDNHAFTKSAYQTKVSKKYVVDSESDAVAGGLTDKNLYILQNRIPYEVTGLAAEETSTFLQSNFIANIYSNVTKMEVTDNEDNTHTYSASLSYSYDGDLNDEITENFSVSFIMDETKEQLISAHYVSDIDDISKSDPTDAYHTGTDVSVTLSYETRTERNTTIHSDDYFLSTLNDISLTRNLDPKAEILNPDEIPSDVSYLFATASDYSPEKAVDLSMTATSSSDPSVVSVTNGSMAVLKTGTTTLSFTYFGKEDGVYKEMIFQKTITIVTPKATSVYVFSPKPDVQNKTLLQGKEYDYDYTVSPSKADQSVTVSSSDSTIIEASLVGSKVHLKAVKPGNASITVTSVSNPSAFYTLDLTVQSNEIDFATYITTKTYVATTTYGYSFSMVFYADGTGNRTETVTSTGATYDDAFTYTLNDDVITFNFTTTFKPFETGTITNNGDAIKCECGESGGYASYNFIAQ